MTKISIKKLELCQAWLKEIKSLDKQIIEIERMALLVSGGKSQCKFHLDIKDLQKEADEKVKVSLDGEGFLVLGGPVSSRSMFDQYYKLPNFTELMKGEKIINLGNKHFTNGLSDSTVLRILAIILEEKQRERELLIGHLEKVGFTFS